MIIKHLFFVSLDMSFLQSYYVNFIIFSFDPAIILWASFQNFDFTVARWK